MMRVGIHRTRGRRLGLPVAVAVVLCATLAVPGATQTAERGTAHLATRAAQCLERAAAALAARNVPDAYEACIDALRLAPNDPSVLANLAAVAAAANEPDAVILWVHRFQRAGGDPAKLPDAVRLATGRDRHVRDLARARERAMDQLRAFLKRPQRKRRWLAHRWAMRLATETARHDPTLLAGFDDVTPILPNHAVVVRGLQSLRSGAGASGKRSLELRAAAVLAGLESQARFPDLRGVRPRRLSRGKRNHLAKYRALTAAWRTRARVHTVEELKAMEPRAQIEFAFAHRKPDDPIACWTPNRRYRIETTCGPETLVTAAETTEQCHARLVAWFGHDPLKGRPGIIRIVPGPPDLAAEGILYHWVEGQQDQDLTIIAGRWSSTLALARRITHELTHRFQNALRKHAPSWYREGEAVWTEHAFAAASDKAFVPSHAVFERIDRAGIDGFAQPRRLRSVLSGHPQHYRHNYTAGYALFVFLRTWTSGGRRPYAAALDRYLRMVARARKATVHDFTRTILDGREGRAGDLDAFCESFDTFVRGFSWLSPAKWTSRYQPAFRYGGGRSLADLPAWPEERDASAPRFGERIARRAARLFTESAKSDLAARAWHWALAVDEWTRHHAIEATRAFDRARDRESRWLLARLVAHRFGPTTPTGRRPPPFRDELSAWWRLLETYGRAVTAYRTAGRTTAAGAFMVEHDRIATLLGAGRLGEPPSHEVETHPLNDPPWHAGAYGWRAVSSPITDRAVIEPRNWAVDASGDLLLGRRRARSGTGTVDRRAIGSQTYVRSGRWLARGPVVLDAKITPTTAYFETDVLLAYGGTDRFVRLRLAGGDAKYSIGKKGKDRHAFAFERLSLKLDARREESVFRPTFEPHVSLPLPRPQPSFEVRLALHQAGPHAPSMLHAFIDGRPAASMQLPVDLPLDGFVAFGTTYGSCRITDPTVRRYDRDRRVPGRNLLLDPNEPRAFVPLASYLHRSIADVSRASRVQLWLWLPQGTTTEAVAEGAPAYLLRALASVSRYTELDGCMLVVPEDAQGAERAVDRLRRHGYPHALRVHRWPTSLTGKRPNLLLVEAGRLRAVVPVDLTQNEPPFEAWVWTWVAERLRHVTAAVRD